MLILLLQLLFALPMSPTPDSEAHEFHLSKCNIQYSKEENTLQISLHLFLDDLETSMNAFGLDSLFLCTEKEIEDADTSLHKYLASKLKFKIDDADVDYAFIGKEISEDLVAVWCYLEIQDLPIAMKELQIENSVLMETFDDQKNIVDITLKDKKKGFFLFQKGSSSDTVKW